MNPESPAVLLCGPSLRAIPKSTTFAETAPVDERGPEGRGELEALDGDLRLEQEVLSGVDHPEPALAHHAIDAVLSVDRRADELERIARGHFEWSTIAVDATYREIGVLMKWPILLRDDG